MINSDKTIDFRFSERGEGTTTSCLLGILGKVIFSKPNSSFLIICPNQTLVEYTRKTFMELLDDTIEKPTYVTKHRIEFEGGINVSFVSYTSNLWCYTRGQRFEMVLFSDFSYREKIDFDDFLPYTKKIRCIYT